MRRNLTAKLHQIKVGRDRWGRKTASPNIPPHFALERHHGQGHNRHMISNTVRIIGYLLGVAALYVLWLALTATSAPSIVLGQFWFERHAASLQVTEAIISRYIDPCGLIVALGCEPFLWHPLLATLLGWPTAVVLFMMTGLLLGLVRITRGGGDRKIRGRDLKRRGEK